MDELVSTKLSVCQRLRLGPWMMIPLAWVVVSSLPLQARERPNALPVSIPVLDKGEFIMFSHSVFQQPTDETSISRRARQLEWIKRFRICLTNGYENFAGQDLQNLHDAGCELFLYRWFNGFYRTELLPEDVPDATKVYLSKFPAMVQLFREVRSHPEWLLNPDSPIQGSGAEHPAYFYDYANPEFRSFFVASIQRDLQQTHYDGVFFDYIGSWALPTEVKAIWHDKHPELTYDEAGLQFLRELRQALGDKRVLGNQAYRLRGDYYGLIDYDISESLATSFVWGKEALLDLQGSEQQTVRDTFYRPWDGPGGYQETARQRLDMAARWPRVRVCDINYLQPWYVPAGEVAAADGTNVPVFAAQTDRPAIFYGYAITKLVGGYVYASDWFAEGLGEDGVYFLDLGEPVEEHFVETPDVVVRYYENGFVVITRSSDRVTFQPDSTRLPEGVVDLWDVYAGAPVSDWSSRRMVEIVPAHYPSTDSRYPSGRVFMYLKTPVGK